HERLDPDALLHPHRAVRGPRLHHGPRVRLHQGAAQHARPRHRRLLVRPRHLVGPRPGLCRPRH
ncbi:hypothetical protein BN1708_020632, partial [Verticillium longisporum]